jgi:SAM-dependent methyltransferase
MNNVASQDYNAFHASIYDHHSLGLPGELQFYVEQARAADGPVLELGCGTGRILIPTAEAGVAVTGVDASPHMLALARDKLGALPPEVRARVALHEGDMRTFSLPERFRLITVPYRAFLHLLTVEDQRQALARIRDQLTPDGRLVLNIFDPRLDILMAHLGPTGSALKHEGEFVRPENGRRVVVWDTRQYDLDSQIVHQRWIFEELDENDRTLSRTHSSTRLRFVYRYEMQHLLELCGFEVEALYGDFDRGPFRSNESEQIWVAKPR